MTATTALFVVLVGWLTIGAITSIVMARRGHDPYWWAALGALWGPLVIPVAITAGRDERDVHAWSRVERKAATAGPGPLHVLVGIDGSGSSDAGALMARQLLGDRLGLLTLATVVDYESADSERHNITAATDHAHRALERAAELVGGDAKTVVLTGRPAATLIEYGLANDVDLIVIGSRGRGLSRSLIGHVTSRLVRQTEIPLLVAGAQELEPKSL